MSDARSITDQFFFANTGMDPDRVTKLVTRALSKADGGELFLQRLMGKSASFSDGRLVASTPPSLDQGFGFRYISGASASYAHSSDLSEANIKKLAAATKAIRNYSPSTGRVLIPSDMAGSRLYTLDNPLDDVSDADRIKILEEVDAYARAADPRVIQVSANIATGWNVMTIIRHDGKRFDDVRPMSQFSVNLIVKEGDRKEQGFASVGKRMILSDIFAGHSWKSCVDDALHQATTNLCAMPAPSGDDLPVVLGNGWAAVMLHESVGHGLEGDAARKGASVYAGMVGQKVASDIVTIIDQGNIADERGSLHFDDEGVPTQKTILIENGTLKGFMQDSVSARIMGVAPTGNGRREKYDCQPMTRMTTTYMASGKSDPAEIISSVKDGIYAVKFAGGQVDTVSGDYVFAPTLAFRIRNGKVAEPLKNAVLTGNGPDSMRQVEMVGNDLVLGTTGMCGKSGQSVPVGVGQPTVKMRGIKVGGTQPS